MTMTGSYKQSPAAKAAIDRALKMMSEGQSTSLLPAKKQKKDLSLVRRAAGGSD
jgi:hypothetical protein